MLGAALVASHKNQATAALEHMQQALKTQLAQVPNDINWPAFQVGLAKYAAAQTPHTRAAYPILATQGRVTLRDGGGTGPCVVLVPSLINRGYILDLLPEFSLLESLKGQGHRVLVIDWGDPSQLGTAGDAPLSLETLIVGRLEPLLQHAAQASGGPVALVGYCMGGLLALAASVRLGAGVIGKLAVAAMPWDFTQTTSHAHMQGVQSWLEPLLQTQPLLLPHLIAQYFWGLDPWGPLRRIAAYGTETDPARLAHLTALEDWLADGLALDGPIAAEILLNWYANNTPLKGQWQVGGTPIVPHNLSMPLHVTLTQTDKLVPLASSLPFIGQTKGATVHMAQSGHVSLVAGRRAPAQFYEPLGGWLK
jgi:poly(3-hydroxyalkanoate) synthetase